MADMRIDLNLVRHWKFRKLRRIVGPAAMEHLITFWSAVSLQCPDGDLAAWSAKDIDDAAEVPKSDGKFCAALIECRLLDTVGNGFYPHDWHEHQSWVVGSKERKLAASLAGKASAEAKRLRKQQNNGA